VRAVAPRNIVLLQEPPPACPIVSRLEAALESYFTHVHNPPAGLVVTLPATACYAAALTPSLAEAASAAGTVSRPPYRLGWLDGVVTGALLQKCLSLIALDSLRVCGGIVQATVYPGSGSNVPDVLLLGGRKRNERNILHHNHKLSATILTFHVVKTYYKYPSTSNYSHACHSSWVCEPMFDGSVYPKNLMKEIEYVRVLQQ
jgi:hypothetical protein